MINYDFTALSVAMIGSKISRPKVGTISGHAAGEPFDKLVYSELQKQFPTNTYRQFEYLNELYLNNPTKLTAQERFDLIPNNTLKNLLNRGVAATKGWSKTNIFEEKQDDTADILLVEKPNVYFTILDVKTRNISKTAQPPNIISALKLAETCALMIDNNDTNFHFEYVEVDWILNGIELECKNIIKGKLFKESPDNLYINWAAAMQIQFHVVDLEQKYTGTKLEWAKEYLKHFTEGVSKRAGYMEEKYIKPYLKYLE